MPPKGQPQEACFASPSPNPSEAQGPWKEWILLICHHLVQNKTVISHNYSTRPKSNLSTANPKPIQRVNFFTGLVICLNIDVSKENGFSPWMFLFHSQTRRKMSCIYQDTGSRSRIDSTTWRTIFSNIKMHKNNPRSNCLSPPSPPFLAKYSNLVFSLHLFPPPSFYLNLSSIGYLYLWTPQLF